MKIPKPKLHCVPGLIPRPLPPHHVFHISRRGEDLGADSVVVIQQGVHLSGWNGSPAPAAGHAGGRSGHPEVRPRPGSSSGGVEQLRGAGQLGGGSSRVGHRPQGGSQQERDTSSTHLSPVDEEQQAAALRPCRTLRGRGDDGLTDHMLFIIHEERKKKTVNQLD